MRQNVFDTLQQEAVSSEDNVFAQFLQTKGLYDHIEITEKNISELCDLIGGKVKLNLYCKICEETRVFSMQATTFLFPVDDDKKEIRSLAKELMWNQRFQTMKDTPRPGENQEENGIGVIGKHKMRHVLWFSHLSVQWMIRIILIILFVQREIPCGKLVSHLLWPI